jgi:hypothetical protein
MLNVFFMLCFFKYLNIKKVSGNSTSGLFFKFFKLIETIECYKFFKYSMELKRGQKIKMKKVPIKKRGTFWIDRNLKRNSKID